MKKINKYKTDMEEIMDICLKFCENRNPDSNTKQTFKVIFDIAEKATKNPEIIKEIIKYEKLRKKTARILQKKNHNDIGEYFYTNKLDNY